MYVICWQDYDCTEMIGYTSDLEKAESMVETLNVDLDDYAKSKSSMFYFYKKLEVVG